MVHDIIAFRPIHRSKRTFPRDRNFSGWFPLHSLRMNEKYRKQKQPKTEIFHWILLFVQNILTYHNINKKSNAYKINIQSKELFMDATFAEKHVMPLCHIEVYLSLFFLQDQIYLENQLSESWQDRIPMMPVFFPHLCLVFFQKQSFHQ